MCPDNLFLRSSARIVSAAEMCRAREVTCGCFEHVQACGPCFGRVQARGREQACGLGGVGAVRACCSCRDIFSNCTTPGPRHSLLQGRWRKQPIAQLVIVRSRAVLDMNGNEVWIGSKVWWDGKGP